MAKSSMSLELGGVRRGHDDHSGKSSHVRDVEEPVVRRPVGADEPRAVDCKDARQALERYLVKYLVVRPLEECRVNRDHRDKPRLREPRREPYSVLLAYADVEEPVGKLASGTRPSPCRPASPRLSRQPRLSRRPALDERARQKRSCTSAARRPSVGATTLPLWCTKGDARVIVRGVVLGRPEAAPLVVTTCMRMGLSSGSAVDLRERLAEELDIVAVVRPEIRKPHLLEELPRHDGAADAVADLGDRLLHRRGRIAGCCCRSERTSCLSSLYARADADAVEVRGYRADGLGDAHLVVVEDDEQALAQMRAVIEGLERHPGRHRAVANEGDDAPLLAPASRFRPRGPTPGRARRRRGPRRRRRTGSRPAIGKPERPPSVRIVGKRVAPAGEDLVGVDLVADVEDQPVLQQVISPVKSDG